MAEEEVRILPSQRKTILDMMAEQRKSGTFTDVTFMVGERQVEAHRNVVAAASPYFQAMFSSGMRESHDREIRLVGLDADAFELLIDFFYTSRLKLTEANVEEVLRVASVLQVDPAVGEWCCSFLRRQLDPHNCLGVARLADTLGCAELLDAALSYAATHFSCAAKSEEFLPLPLSIVLAVTSQEDLCVDGEVELFNALMAWVRHDVVTRQESLSEVLSCVRFPLLGPQFLTEVVDSDPLFAGDPKCCALVKAATDYLREVGERASSGGAMFVGMAGNAEYFLSSFGPVIWPVTWRRLVYPRDTAPVCVASVGRHVYVCGCASGTNVRLDAYNVDTNSWAECCPPLPGSHTQGGLEVCIFDYTGCLCAVTMTMSTCLLHRYCHENNTWHVTALDLIHSEVFIKNEVRHLPLVAIGNSLYFFVAGFVRRHDLISGDATNSQCITPQSDVIGAVAFQGRVYTAFDSYDSYARDGQNFVQCYDPVEDNWSLCGDSSVPSDIMFLLVFSNRLFALCGESSCKECHVFEFDSAGNKWTWHQDFTRPFEFDMRFAVVAPAVDLATLPQGTFAVDCSLIRGNHPPVKLRNSSPRSGHLPDGRHGSDDFWGLESEDDYGLDSDSYLENDSEAMPAYANLAHCYLNRGIEPA